MHIVQLTAGNVKRLHAVDITPEGNIVTIAGRNGQGKTSVLDAIWFALGGATAMKETPEVIRQGEVHAKVTLDLGDLVVDRHWVNGKTTLAVKSKEGAVHRSPQALLDSLVGKISFDPRHRRHRQAEGHGAQGSQDASSQS